MIDALWRKAAQVATDPVLRRWMVARAARREAPVAPFTPHAPPYLAGTPPFNGIDAPAATDFAELIVESPDRPIDLPLPGAPMRLAPGETSALFDASFDDLETTLAVHRFAWLPLLGPAVPPSWVDTLWRAWAERHATPDDGWAWHPYTAAERVINVLDFARRHGLPGPRRRTLALLAEHGRTIADRLEYFGEHNTSNHLSNNGRGLYLLGLALGIPAFADLGRKILLAEAARILGQSGMLREGSTHYHLLVTRNYMGAWLAARKHGRPEADALRQIARQTLAAARWLLLPGGLPLIGDISPDCPPAFLAGLANGTREGWTGFLNETDRAALDELAADLPPADPEELAHDGWARCGDDGWACLIHAAPDGWPPMPGHAHQDMGSFEAHFAGAPVFIDVGRGAYGDRGEAAHYAGAAVHNGVTIDGRAPYPRNRPYYSDAFRRDVGGEAPRIGRTARGLSVSHHGFARIAGVGRAERDWSLANREMRITDRIAGQGRHKITRRLHTPHPVEVGADGVRITTTHRTFRLATDVPPQVAPIKRWVAYGESVPATAITFSREETLPVETALTIEAL